MSLSRRFLLASPLALAIALAVATDAQARDPKEIVIGTSAGPYADQVKLGIKPILEQQGYKVRIVEFNDYIQPNFALAEGSLDANVFQHATYLTRFAVQHKLALAELVKVPTAPIAIYSRRHKSLDAVKSGSTVALPNDPTNQARALVMLDLVAVKSADRDKPFARDLAAAYRSRAFLDVTNKHFADYAKTDYQLALQSPTVGAK